MKLSYQQHLAQPGMIIRVGRKGLPLIEKTMGKTQTKDTVEFEQVIARGCGIDIHKKVLVATVAGTGLKCETLKFSSFTEEIESLRDWLKSYSVIHVAMEGTGVYWTPVFNILEEDFEVLLVNAAHLKSIPGNKNRQERQQAYGQIPFSRIVTR